MTNVNLIDGCESSEYVYSQTKVGAIKITQMHYAHSSGSDMQITIYKDGPKENCPDGHSHYAIKLFEGSLKEIVSTMELAMAIKPFINSNQQEAEQ